MAINFSELPQESPNALPDPGLYMGVVREAEMKQPNDLTKPEQLVLTIALSDDKGRAAGVITDYLTESGTGAMNYKIGRFGRACGIPPTAVLELKDLAKLVKGRTVAVDVNHSKPQLNADGTVKYEAKAQVNLFGHECYYLATEYAETRANFLGTASCADEACPINIPDNATEAGTPFDDGQFVPPADNNGMEPNPIGTSEY